MSTAATDTTTQGDILRTAPPLRAIVALVVLVVVTVAGGLILYALTPAAERPNPWPYAGVAFSTLVTGVPAVLAWLSARSADASSTNAANALNGGFEERVMNIVHDTLNERDKGVTLHADSSADLSGQPAN